MTRPRPHEFVEFQRKVIDAITALDALSIGHRLSSRYLDALESVSSSLHTVAVLPMLLPDMNAVTRASADVQDQQYLHLFILDVLHRRRKECGLVLDPKKERDLQIIVWHASLLKAICGTEPLNVHDRRHMREVAVVLHILSIESGLPDDLPLIVARLSSIYSTARV